MKTKLDELEPVKIHSPEAKKLFQKWLDACFGPDDSTDGKRNAEKKSECWDNGYGKSLHAFMAGLGVGQEGKETLIAIVTKQQEILDKIANVNGQERSKRMAYACIDEARTVIEECKGMLNE